MATQTSVAADDGDRVASGLEDVAYAPPTDGGCDHRRSQQGEQHTGAEERRRDHPVWPSHEVRPAEQPCRRHWTAVQHQAAHPERGGGIGNEPGERHPEHRPRHLGEHAERKGRHEVAGEDQLVVRRVVHGTPGEPRGGHDGDQREEPDQRDAPGARSPVERRCL